MRRPSKPRKRKKATETPLGKTACRQPAATPLDRRRFLLDEKQFAAFERALDAAPPPGQNLQRLMQKRPLWQRARIARDR